MSDVAFFTILKNLLEDRNNPTDLKASIIGKVAQIWFFGNEGEIFML